MRIHYYRQQLNFGDDLNRWIWKELLPGCWSPHDGVAFSGIGTILNSTMPPGMTWVVFTSGVGYSDPPPRRDERWHIVSVRGPLSAAVLGLPASAAITDGALLLAALPGYAPVPEKERRGIVFVPHHRVEDMGNWEAVCRRAGVELLSPRQDSRIVIERIRTSRLVLAEAMHAAITADAFRVPWIPIVSSPQICTFKWLDWTASMCLRYRPVVLPAATTAGLVRDAMLWAYNQHHAFSLNEQASDRDEHERTLAHFARHYATAPSMGRRLANRAGRGVYRCAAVTLAGPYVARSVGRMDEARVVRVAESLRVASERQPFLSEEPVFRDRVAALYARLADVRAFAGSRELRRGVR